MISRRSLLSALFLALLIGKPPVASDAADNNVVGVWRLTRHVTTYTKTGESTVWKDNAFMTYTPGGHMTVLIVDTQSADAIKAPYVSAYSGTYIVDGNKVTHHVLLNSTGAASTPDLVRIFTINGKNLEIATAPRIGADGREYTSVLTWERVE